MKIPISALLLLCTITLFSQSKADYTLLTKTEWVNSNLDYLRFDADTLTYNLANKRSDLYFDLNKRVLSFEKRYFVGGVNQKVESMRFKIKSLDNRKLVIVPIDDKVNLEQEGYLRLDFEPFFKRKEFIFYNRKNAASEVNFKKITFLASTCFGTCPSFSLEINRDGQVFYQGRLYTKKFTGNFIGSLDDNEIFKLRKLLNRSQISSIHNNWKQATKPNDTPRYNYIIELKNGKLIEISTNDQHPILDRLSDYLINITDVAELKKSQKRHSFEKPKVSAYQIVGIEE